MAIIKHISIKNSNYDAATDYLTLKHDEFTNKPILDENGDKIPRDEFLIEGINCNPFTFGRECEATNAHYGKNQTKDEIKAHHYIISFDPRDKDDNSLTLHSAETMAIDFAKRNFPGHQAIICAHPDGHNSAGNIHVHIVINSLRKFDVPTTLIENNPLLAERPGDALAGHKHHVTNQLLNYLKQETMTMCQNHSLYQVDLLSPAKVKITEREYWAKRKGQAKLDKENAKDIANGKSPKQTIYQTDKDFLRAAITAVLKDSTSYDSLKDKLFNDYGITVTESRGKICYILPDKSRPIRGRQLGTDFEKTHIDEVIAENISSLSDKKYKSSIRLITDIETCLKAQENAGYARKVKISNLQKMADTMSFILANNIESVEALDMLLASTSGDVRLKHKTLKATESRLTQINLLIKYTGQYLANKAIYKQYISAKNKAKFREAHHTEITLYEAARKYLKENTSSNSSNGVAKFTVPNLKKLKEEKERLVPQKNSQYEEYSYARAKYRELQTVHRNIHTILDIPLSTNEQATPKKVKSEQHI